MVAHRARLTCLIAAAVVAVAAPLSGCLTEGASKGVAGLVASDGGPYGPAIVFEPLQRPVPNVPFPNDLLLTPSDGTASAVQWNISTEAPTAVERRLRRQLDELDGFGPYAPATVSFDGPLDLSTVNRDTVLLVNIERDHPREGEVVPLDLGRGFFPETFKPTSYWANDPLVGARDLLLPLDNESDVDGDGVAERVSHYEVATNTLIIRPVLPLAPGATHAVLVTRGVHGYNDAGERAPVRSPFPYKAHVAQSVEVAHALDLVGMETADLAFGWTYTTADVARPMLAIRDGIHGQGPLARLADLVPPGFVGIRDTSIETDAALDPDGRDNRFILQGEWLNDFVQLFDQIQEGIAFTFDNVDYFVFGSLETPDLRTGENYALGVDTETGEGEVGIEDVPFLISVPKTVKDKYEPPFPVVIYFHGTGTSRMEALGIADMMARVGIAVLSIDQVGHGPIIPDIPLALANAGISPELVELLGPVLAGMMVPELEDELVGQPWQDILAALVDVGLWAELAIIGRTTDENGDGALESGEAFYFADPFRQCGGFQQDIVDFFSAVRTLRALSQADVPPALENPGSATAEELLPYLLAGDFNADGVLDIGGPDVRLGTAGTSLGGFHAIMAGALEKEVTVATPIVAGGGFADIMSRSNFWSIMQRIWVEVFGPLVVGCPDGAGGVRLSFNDDSDRCKPGPTLKRSFAHVPAVSPGDLVIVENLDNGEAAGTLVGANGGFSIGVPADRWDQLDVRIFRSVGETAAVPVLSKYEGVGMQRNTPRFRRFLGISEHVLSRCDPMSFARALFIEPYPGHPPTNILFENAVGDRTVPISTGVLVALASGVLGETEDEWGPTIDALIDRGLLAGANYDADDLLKDNPPELPPVGPLPPVQTSTGESSIRFADVDGWHEWVVGVDQTKPFDHASYTQAQITLFHWSGGARVVDDLCIDRHDCPLLAEPDLIFDEP